MTSPRVNARLLEAVSGAAPGLALGGAGGAAFFRPEFPREWIESDGTMGGRQLTDSERATRRKTALKGALGGAVAGAALAVGGSKLRRLSLDRLEQRHLADITAPYVPGLTAARQKFMDMSAGGLGVRPLHAADYVESAGNVEREIQGLPERARAAAARAKQSRDESFFGGRLVDREGRVDVNRSSQGQLWRELASKGVVGKPEEDSMAWISEHRKKAFVEELSELSGQPIEKVAYGVTALSPMSKEDSEPYEMREARRFLEKFTGTPFEERAKKILAEKGNSRMEEARKEVRRAEVRLKEASVDVRRSALIARFVEDNVKKGISKEATLRSIHECENGSLWSDAFKGRPDYADALRVDADSAHLAVVRSELYSWDREERPSNQLYADYTAWRWEQATKQKYVFETSVSPSEKTAAERRVAEPSFLQKEAVRLLSPAQIAQIAKRAPPSGLVAETPLSAFGRSRPTPVYQPPKSAQKGWVGSWDPKSNGVDLTPGINTFEEQHSMARQGKRPLDQLRSPQTRNTIKLDPLRTITPGTTLR